MGAVKPAALMATHGNSNKQVGSFQHQNLGILVNRDQRRLWVCAEEGWLADG